MSHWENKKVSEASGKPNIISEYVKQVSHMKKKGDCTHSPCTDTSAGL